MAMLNNQMVNQALICLAGYRAGGGLNPHEDTPYLGPSQLTRVIPMVIPNNNPNWTPTYIA